MRHLFLSIFAVMLAASPSFADAIVKKGTKSYQTPSSSEQNYRSQPDMRPDTGEQASGIQTPVSDIEPAAGPYTGEESPNYAPQDTMSRLQNEMKLPQKY